MRIIYKHEGNVFEVGDLVCIEYLNIFTNETETYKGRILKSSENSMLKLDISELFDGKRVNLDMSEIKNIILM